MFSKAKDEAGGRAKRRLPPTIISADMHIDGNIASDGEVQIDGIIDGDVKASKLSIGETGRVRGAVIADRLMVRGRVIGQLRANFITLTRTARVKGDIFHETLAIEPGAQLEGNCKRIEGAVPAPGEPAINLIVHDGQPTRSPA
jgi:cytoskeletal protein CcmA (bactofilin family)